MRTENLIKIRFIDKNERLVRKIKKAIRNLPFNGVFIFVKSGDIFAEEEGVIVSASNPDYSMGGGLDAQIEKRFPSDCKMARKHKGRNYSSRNVIFTITVNKELKATRELVKEALKFALDPKNHKKVDEPVLISGLGTGIGGLDEDDFVWLFLSAIIESNKKYGWGIKYTKKNGYDFKTGKKHYQVGKWLEQKDAPHNGLDCDIGLHLGVDFAGAGNYNMPEKIFFCIYEKKDVCGTGTDKVRVSRLLPVCILPEWLGYGINGKKILAKLGKKVDIKKYNPYKATKLPPKNKLKWIVGVRAQVWAQVRDQVGAQVWAQVGDQVRDQVGAQVRDQVGAQVWAQVRDQVGAQVRDQVGAQVWAQVGDQVRDQVWATSYWAVNLHFELGVVHPFFDFLKLGIMAIFVNGKIKIFGKKGKYLGEYDEKDI